MIGWAKGTKILIWGAGKNAKRHYYKLRDYYEVVAFIDNHGERDQLFGLPVLKPTDIDLFCYHTVICSIKCGEIEEQCKELGLFLWEHFLPYYMVVDDAYRELPVLDIWKYARENQYKDMIHIFSNRKKLAYIEGNCQTRVIKDYLKHSPEFNRRYIFLDIPPMISANRNTDLYFKNIKSLSECELFITQNIASSNKYDSRFETTNMINSLNRECDHLHVIRIPNLFFDLYFPQGGKGGNQNNVLIEELGFGVFPYSDLILDDLSRRFTRKQIREIVAYKELFDKNFLQSYVQYRFAELEAREEKCDVKMVDYLRKHYLEEQLFYCRNHPTNRVIKELVSRILIYMNIPHPYEYEFEDRIPPLVKYQEFIYPSIQYNLGLQFEKTMYSDGDTDESQTFEEVIQKYLSYCHGG